MFLLKWASIGRLDTLLAKTLLLAIPQNCRAGEHVARSLARSLAINMLARETASSLSRNLNEQNTENLIYGKLIMQTPNAAAIAFYFVRASLWNTIVFLNCSAKVAEEKIRYAAYNCLAIDTDVSPWEEWPSSRDSVIVNRRSHEKKRTLRKTTINEAYLQGCLS